MDHHHDRTDEDDDFFPGDDVGDRASAPGRLPPPVRHADALDLDLDLAAPPTGRRWALLALGVVPWAVLGLVLLTRPTTAPPRNPAASGALAEQQQGAVPGAATPGTPATETATSPPLERVTAAALPLAGAAGAVPSTRPAEAVAVAVARATLGSAGPSLAIEGMPAAPAGHWVEHVAIEHVELPEPGFAVVTVVAIVLESDAGEYDRVVLRRIAVPIEFRGATARPAGPPWPLPPPDLTPRAPALVPADDPATEAAASSALAAAGYRDVVLGTIAHTDGWPLVAVVTAIAPGGTGAAEHRVWLRPHLDGLVVAGTIDPEVAP